MAPPVLPISSLFPFQVATSQAVPYLDLGALYPEELPYIATSVPKRQAEFVAGRVCVRRALHQLGYAPSALPMRHDRSPRWPKGIVGSISHTDGYCCVVVVPASRALGVGLDVEQAIPLSDNLQTSICAHSELQWISRHPSDERGMLAKITFVVKEAFYKCQYGITEEMLDFLEVEMAIHLGDCTWRVERVRRREPLWRGFEGIGGRFIVEQELIAAGVGIPAATDGVSL